MKRILVIFALFLLSMITYIDRVCISSAKGPISSELGFTDAQMGLVFGAFALGYALAQVPSGWLADRFGPRLALAAVVTLWSAFTGFTGMATGFAALLAIRFLFGLAEAGAFPGAARAFYNWLPPGERGRANGVIFSGSRLGAALSFPLLNWLLSALGWRVSFYLLGIVGIIWAAFWLLWFRDYPAQPQSKPASPAPARFEWSIFRLPGLSWSMFQYFAGNFTFFICLSWMLPYLQKRYQLSGAEAASWSVIPLLGGASANWIAGFIVDALFRSRFRAWSRALPAIAGFLLTIAGLLYLPHAPNAASAAACFALAAFGADLTISPSWSFCADIGCEHSGAVSGAMNMLGNVGSFISSVLFPVLAPPNYFRLAALLNVLAVLAWLRMRALARSKLESV